MIIFQSNVAFSITVALICTANFSPAGSGEFHAYYTKVDDSSTDYMGKYADIIVALGKGRQLEFTRQTGFLPRWRTPQVVTLMSDFFPTRKRDYTFDYNYVRLIKDTPDEIVVHWRYMPDVEVLTEANRELNPLVVDGITGVVHEIFRIHPDGTVQREIHEATGTRYEDWINPDSITRQTIRLQDDGVRYEPVQWANRSPSERPPVAGSPGKEVAGLPEPCQAWLFDEGLDEHEEFVVDSVTEMEVPLPGLMTVYKKGVSGTALAFDGYYTGVTVEENLLPPLSNEMTIEAWLALDVFPYNTAPIAHRSLGFGEQGYYLGVDASGHPTFTVNGVTISGETALPLHAWAHVAATVGRGEARLFVDGKEVASSSYHEQLNEPEAPLMIGLNSEKRRCTDCVRGDEQNLPFIYGIQGLVDELKIYDEALTKVQIAAAYSALKPANLKSDLAAGVLPGEVGSSEAFGASYKTLHFQELWDKMWRVTNDADIVVKFDDNPCSVVFWRGTNYGSGWVTDRNRWMADQSSEIFTKHGCSEHMADKQVRHCYARIVENTPARAVVHWRYPCVDVSYLCTSRVHWTDEYYTIYPDGTGVRKVVWNQGYDPPGFQDIQFLTNPGETALDVMNLQAVTVANADGEVRELTWQAPNNVPRNTLRNSCIAVFNSKSKFKVFAIYQGHGIGPWGRDEQSKYTADPFAGPWNHWPVHLVPSDGRFAVAADRVTHFALGGSDAEEFGSMIMYGFTEQPVSSLVPLAKMWRNPPQVTDVEGATSQGYDKAQRAFVLTDCSASKIALRLSASDDSPVVNPCLVLKNWECEDDAAVIVDGRRIDPSREFRQGIAYDTNGARMKVIWLEWNSNKPVDVRIQKVNRQQE